MTTSPQARIAALTQRMLRKKFFVVFSTATASPAEIEDVLPLHLEYMIALEKKGVVFASGPLTGAGDAPRGNGMTVLRAASAEEARAIAEADPLFTRGLRSFEIREWTVMEGSLALKVNFSDQSIDVS
jgi:uncharacterized protein